MSANSGPNMTPMVDIVMCILIFFMLASSFVMPELFLTSNTPAIDKKGISGETSDTPAPAVQNKLVVQKYVKLNSKGQADGPQAKVLAFGSIYEDIEEQLGSALAQKKKELSDDVQIIIVPEKSVRYQDVITVYDACMKARFKNVAFGMPK